ncbi:MAG: transporter substrate-binding domain-containing protein [Clostridia bacterium]|nr:transporter substrate-binding domain-containing protein [Clostridia bacterium]
MRNISRYKKVFTACVKIIPAFAVFLIFIFSNLVLFNFKTAFAEVSSFKNVKAGVFYFEGYHTQEDGKLTGYGVEFLNLVSEYSRINFEYVGYDKDWDDMIPMLDKGEIDVVTSAGWTEDRAEKFAFSLPIGRRKTVLSVQVDNTDIHRGDYKTYNGKKVGLVKGSSQNESLDKFETDNKFAFNRVEYENSKDLAAALQNGEVDAILSSDLRKANNEKTLDVIKEDDFYAIVRKEDTKLLEEINYAIEQMNINEGDWQNVLFYKYYGPSYSSALTFTARETEYIRQVVEKEKTIKVTAFGGRAPYSFTEDGELKGIVPDYFAEVMSLAGRTAGLPEGLPYEIVIPKDHDDYHSIVDKNEVNVVIDSMGYDGSGFNTDSYMTATMARVTRNDLKGGVKVIAVSESQGKDLIPQEFLDAYSVRSYETGDEAMRAVLDGKADAAYVFAYTAQLFVNRDSSHSLYYSVVNGMSTTFSLHVSEDTDHELITILNKCIKQIPDDTLNRLASNYTSFTIGDLSFIEYMKANPAVPFSVLFALVVITVVIIALVWRGRWNKKLLNATAQTNKKMGEQLAIVEALSRDYTNVYSVNEEAGTAQVIKLEGYVAEGLKKDSTAEYNYASVLEKYINSRVHPDDRLELAKALSLVNVREKLAADNEYLGSYRIIENDEVHNFQYTFLKIADGDDGRGDFILLGFRNIDEVIRKEQEQKNAMSEALAQAQYANKAKTTFLNSMSHDIRTPMNAIIGFTSLALTHLDNKEQIRNYLGKIMTSGNHLLSLINDVLDMSRIESGKVRIEEKENSLTEIVHDLETIVQADVKAKQLDFSIKTVNVKNETIICDKLRLNQVLLNILSNAMKYTKPEGKVTFRVKQLDDAPEGYAAFEFSVKDTGIGMSPEFLKHVFEPFEREQTSTVSGIQGTGLGLAITKNIVDMMGGTIKVESEVGKGSEFIVTFCFKVGGTSAKPKKKAKKSVDDGVFKLDFAGKKILLVEDNELNQEIAQTVLEGVGFVIDTADDGSIAVEQVKKMPAGTYDVILMDVQMPIMNGYQATKAIRALDDPAKAATPIVAMTANAFDEDRKEALDSGMNGYVDKPIVIEKLLKELENILK